MPAPRVPQETENSNSEVDSDNFETASEVSGPEPDPSTEDTADSSSPGAEPDTESPVEETILLKLNTLPLYHVAILPELGNLLIGITLLVLELIL